MDDTTDIKGLALAVIGGDLTAAGPLYDLLTQWNDWRAAPFAKAFGGLMADVEEAVERHQSLIAADGTYWALQERDRAVREAADRFRRRVKALFWVATSYSLAAVRANAAVVREAEQAAQDEMNEMAARRLDDVNLADAVRDPVTGDDDELPF